MKEELAIQIYLMDKHVRAQEKEVNERAKKKTFESQRDIAKEQYEQAQRRRQMEMKSNAIIKFETSLAPILGRKLKQSTVEAFKSVQEPLFNPWLNQYLKGDNDDENVN